MKIKPIAQACMWLPGFGPDEDPFEVLGILNSSNVSISEIAQEQQAQAIWPKLEATHHASISTPVPKYEANIAAIKLLRKLEQEGRTANSQEHAILSQYTGWGGLVKALDGKTSDTAWLARHEELKALLTDKEFDSATTSSLNAYFTPVTVVEAIWRAVQRLGFKGGNVLEPSCGAGYFIGGMPQELARKCRITAVELDDVSARMTKVMYEQYGVKVLHSEIERARLPEGGFDLVIGNPPFGNEKASELRNVPFSNFSLHNYFIAKALELVRPGGLVAFITSTGTMDSHTNGHREYISGVAKLVQAIRLPRDTFKEIAGTSVTTDLLIFQKREVRAPMAQEPSWMESMLLPRSSSINGDWHHSLQINEYFIHNPRGVIGKVKAVTSQRGLSVACEYDGDVNAALQERVDALPEGIYKSKQPATTKQSASDKTITLSDVRRPGLVIIEGKVYEVDGDQAKPLAKTGKTQDRLISLIEVRDCLRTLIAAQAARSPEDLVTSLRIGLNIAYDKHVKEFGYLSENANKRAFSPDPDLPLLLSIEEWDAEKRTATKATIFERNTLAPAARVQRCESAKEALQVVMAETGRVVPQRIAQLCGRSVEEVMAELQEAGLVYLDPETEAWESADAYLSGNVRHKLSMAQYAGDEFKKNAEALEAAMPRQLKPDEIKARMGSTWIPATLYAQFLNETFNCTRNVVEFESRVGAWSVNTAHELTYGVAATQTFGTNRVNAGTLFEMELNQRKPTIYDKTDDGGRVVNTRETVVAREKQHLLKEAFVEWLWKDRQRAQLLADQYNQQFRSVVARKFDGSHLMLPGMSGAYTLRPHQRDAVWRVISSQYNTLLAHAVGAGKTLEMICAGMELRRLGMAKKVMYVVPNHMLLDFANGFMKAYPSAKVLAASKDDLTGAKRKLMLSRIATHEWDAVIVTQATFESIKISDSYMRTYIEEELWGIESALRERSKYEKGSIVKELARAKKVWKDRLEKFSKQSTKDDLLCFEELGIDYLAIDEFHCYKNRWRFSKMDRVAGLPNTNSQRSFDVYVKTQYVQRSREDGKGLIAATATPISNSMGEIWTMMGYLSAEMLADFGVQHFDSWAANFGETVTALELSPDGSGYRMQARFARFLNVPELMSMFRLVADIRTADMLDLPVPTAERQTVSVEPSEDLRNFVQELVERAADIRSGGVKPSKDNMLKVTGDGRKAALDVRLVGLPAPADKSGKIYACARNVHRLWVEYADSKAAQIIFCDLSTPSSTGEFTAYSEVRKELVMLGIPEAEIAFIHDYETDAQKDELFQAVRRGSVRVVMGSTSKLGMGTNVQDRLIALHHLDIPWRTSDMEQREGRIIRQGNMFTKVFLFTYLTSASFDAYMAQLLHNKAKFIAQVMIGNDEIRTLEDVEAATLSYAEIKAIASGNPLVLERAGVEAELTKLAVLRQAWERQQSDNRAAIKFLPDEIAATLRTIANIEADMATVAAKDRDKTLIVDGVALRKESDAHAALALAMQRAKPEFKLVGSVGGFKLWLRRAHEFSCGLRVEGLHTYSAGLADTPEDLIRILTKTLKNLDESLRAAKLRLSQMERNLADMKVEVTKPFAQQDRYLALIKRQSEIDTALELTTGDVAAMDESEQSEDAVTA
jgi:N12 class adenine-specific DNA methylase/predicted RNA methylase